MPLSLVQPGGALGETGHDTARSLVERALRRAAQRRRRVIVSIGAPAAGAPDPSAVVLAARGAGDDWFCLEQPSGGGASVAGLGVTRALEAAGPDRFEQLSRRWSELLADAVFDEPSGPPGSGLAAVGGFAFAGDGGQSPNWRGFRPASLHVPAVTLARRDSCTWITVNVHVAASDTTEGVLDGIHGLLARLRDARLPLLDPDPAGRYEIASVMPPSHYEQAVASAVERIRAGEFEKLVLAREVDVHAPRAHDPAAVLGLLRGEFHSSFVYAVGRGERSFIGATPELLVRRQGQRATTVALAGSMRRSADPAVDDHLNEQLLHSDKDRHENAIVARRIARALRRHALWVSVADEPVVVKVANIQHLATPIRAQLAAPMDAIALAGVLHPTPAVGAEPVAGLSAIPALEGVDRGWYAGTVGWVDASGDGEFCVALRCALLHDRVARCYAGCGIVADSEPSSELAETEIKLQAMLSALSA
jgi:menaquinone-specific isochorismate synthase